MFFTWMYGHLKKMDVVTLHTTVQHVHIVNTNYNVVCITSACFCLTEKKKCDVRQVSVERGDEYYCKNI